MELLITGAAGNLGSALTRHLLGGPHRLRLLIHHREPPPEIATHPQVTVCPADLARPNTLAAACRKADCIVHLAGVLFAPRPERFLPTTNLDYVKHLVAATRAGAVKKFILISFPHVEGETFPDQRATDRLDGAPASVHARTRLAAERHVLAECAQPVVLRAGMIYGRGVLMIEAARWLARRRLLAVWREPTWEHLLALPDFLSAVTAAIEGPRVRGIYNVADDQPVTLQQFLDAATAHWGYAKPWRLPRWMFPVAGGLCELVAAVAGTKSPLTRDFIRIGMSSSVADTTRMKNELLPKLQYPTLTDGLPLL